MPPTQQTVPTIEMSVARNQLACIWFAGAAVCGVASTIAGLYNGNVVDALLWFVPTTVPTLSLIIGVLGGAIGSPDRRRADRFFFRLTRWLSLGYLAVVCLTALVQLTSSRAPSDVIKVSSAWLAPLQGIVVGAMGHMFSSRHTTGKDGGGDRADLTRGAKGARPDPPTDPDATT